MPRPPAAPPAPRRRQAGFSFIEILVVMGIISVLVSMVVVVIPMITEKANQAKSTDNVSAIIKFILNRATGSTRGKWPPYDGKNFTLAPLAHGDVSANNLNQLEIFFSPGDTIRTLDVVDPKRFKDVTPDALKQDTNFNELTSYAGRRNKDQEHMITAKKKDMDVIIVCDDDDGALHHTKGMVVGRISSSVRFVEWADLGLSEPEDADHPPELLGDNSPSEELRGLWGR